MKEITFEDFMLEVYQVVAEDYYSHSPLAYHPDIPLSGEPVEDNAVLGVLECLERHQVQATSISEQALNSLLPIHHDHTEEILPSKLWDQGVINVGQRTTDA